MNIKRLLLTILAGFVFVFASDFLIHAIWLAPDYKVTSQLWRPETEMQQRFFWMLLGQLLCAVGFAVIWAKGFAGRHPSMGAVFGFFMGLAQQLWTLADFVVMPIPGAIVAKWVVSALLQAVLLGVLIAFIYKPAGVTANERG